MRRYYNHFFVFGIALLGALLIWFSPQFHELFIDLLETSKEFIIRHQREGALIFIILAAVSSMLTFFSSVILVPIAINAWGRELTLLFLWSGWMIGGVIAYCIGRYFGRKIVALFVNLTTLDYYSTLISRHINIFTVFMLRLATPSEIPSYLLGILRYRFFPYVIIYALAELPFAVVSVYAGDALINDQRLLFISIIGAALIIMAGLYYAFHEKI